jgi:HK97 gp10 family phage protein
MPIDFMARGFVDAAENMEKRVNSIKRKAILAGAKVIQDEIVARTPERTGNLKRHIVISDFYTGADGDEYVEIGPSKGKGFYGKFLEFGTHSRATKDRATSSGKHNKTFSKTGKAAHSSGGITAHPFVEPAFIAKRKEALATMGEIVKEAIDNV